MSRLTKEREDEIRALSDSTWNFVRETNTELAAVYATEGSYSSALDVGEEEVND